MFWVLVIISFGSAVFLVSGIGKYRAFVEVMEPLLDDLEKQVKTLEEAGEAEKQATEDAIGRVQEIKEKEISMGQEHSILETQLKAAQEREQALEIAMYKQQFKKSKL